MDRAFQSSGVDYGRFLGRTIPSLLDEACDRNPNATALNERGDDGWTSLSTTALRAKADELALGFRSMGLDGGDRVCLYMHSNVSFCVVDMGCLIGGLVDVPLYLSFDPELITYVFGHAEAEALVVSDAELLNEIGSLLSGLEGLKFLVLATEQPVELSSEMREQIPDEVDVLTLADVRGKGREVLSQNPDAARDLHAAIDPEDLATIIYTSGTTGHPKGVMLSHQNISFNALCSFHEMPSLDRGPGEVAVSFLPMTHVFQRMLQYGYMNYGTTVHFTFPDHIAADIREVRPTLFSTIPRFLEKVYEKIMNTGLEMKGLKRRIFDWAMNRARNHQVDEKPTGLERIPHMVADYFVYRRWRQALGGQLKFAISGGAALREELVRIFDVADITILQGYGLTETSPVIAFNRPWENVPGTVGRPIPGVEVKIAEDGEIVTRGPHVMQGYYKEPERTSRVLDDDGWFHTGDLGEMEDGILRITGRKKSLFKLSTGKYVSPQPLESKLESNPIVEHSVVLGEGRKFCAALIFPNQASLDVLVRVHDLDPTLPLEELIETAEVQEKFDNLVAQANESFPEWSTIKAYRVVPDELTVDGGILTPTHKIRRERVEERYGELIDRMYAEAEAAYAEEQAQMADEPSAGE